MAQIGKAPSASRSASSHFLAEISDPESGVVELPNRGRPKLRRHANRLGARDLALMPSVTRDAPAVRLIQSRPPLRRSKTRKVPFLTYLSTVFGAVAVGTIVGLGIVNGGIPGSESLAQILGATAQFGAKM